MANTYSWTIQKLSYEIGPDSEGHSDIVSDIDWLLTASDEEDPPHEALWSGDAKVTWEEGDDWIPYEDLTEAQVVAWVEAEEGEDGVAGAKKGLDGNIRNQEHPKSIVVANFPWDGDDGA